MCDNLHISVEHFDYYEPDFSFLPRKSNVLIFTSHSIEQIPALDRRVLREMIAATDTNNIELDALLKPVSGALDKHASNQIRDNQIKVTDEQKIDVARHVYLLEKKHFYIDCISYDTTLRKFY